MDGDAEERPASSGYFFPPVEHPPVDALDLLHELRLYRESNARMRSKVRDDMGMGEKDLTALRLLLAAQARGEVLRQQDLARHLGIRPASVSVLVDRLVRDGYAERSAHPEDRRSTAVHPTAAGSEEVHRTLNAMHARMLAVAASLTPAERGVVTRFLRELNHALDAQP
ncbi:MarR family winged helix-turn-helix transcriptional regulator [Brachybacterium sp. AOP25-B2-12]|uniref:MarR family winged helix-turn-helix transcriptional regulator n=1 Tax=Brachybacterium sp. AOP25-B2-12 TaxID=3457710 RepID=UPI004034D7A2